MSCASWWDYGGPPPLHATRRTPGRRTEGPRVALVGQALGTPLLPWQRYTADVAGELLEDGSYAYSVVIVTVPRQSGKTTLVRAVGTDRCIAREDFGVFYTAQTGKDARERWADLVKAIKRGPLSGLVRVRTAAGSERVVWPNGSTFRCFSPVPTSLHGYTPDLVMLDEVFAYDQQTGDDLMGAIGPAQITLRHRQLWIVSTAGTAASTFLRQWVESGRAGDQGVAIFEWAAGDDVADIYDPAAWPTFHPGMVPTATGQLLVTPEAVAAEAHRMTRAEFERAYGNRWTRTRSTLIPAEQWDRLADPDQLPPDLGTDVVYGYDVMPDRSAAALVAVWRDQAGQLQAKVANSGRGTSWLVPAAAQLRAWGWRRFAYADDGPARELAAQIPGSEPVSGRAYADAWGALLEHIRRGSLTHDGTDALAVAAGNVATRPMLDTAAPSRRASAGDVTPLLGLLVGAAELDRVGPPVELDYRFSS